eukprot:m51a1_g713 hypothetical protein (1036) ;mRNA; r:417436-421771
MSWFSSRKKKNRFSLEHLRELHKFLEDNGTVTEQNRAGIIETIRDAAEVLIWGDQHKTDFFDFFLEKNMMQLLINLLRQKDKGLKIQLIQTLSILIENIREPSSLFYLLSNNHINNMIAHEFDYGDEDLLAYYISFLKTLSLKLDGRSVHFFFNQQKHDFPLYTEAIKFFNNREGMVRIAVRVITLNVYRLEDPAVRKFVLNNSASPYFGNLTWFIRRQCHLLDSLVLRSNKSEKRRVEDLLDEVCDNLEYVQDILNLENETLNRVLIRKILDCLVLPLFCSSLCPDTTIEDKMAPSMALFMLAQFFAIFKTKELVNTVADYLFHPEPQQTLLDDTPPPPLITHGTNEEGGKTESRDAEGSGTIRSQSVPDNAHGVAAKDSVEQSIEGTNRYKGVLLSLIGQSDTLAYFAELMMYSFIRNPSVNKVLLEESGLLPYHLSQSRRLLDYLTAQDKTQITPLPRARRCLSVNVTDLKAQIARKTHPWCVNLEESLPLPEVMPAIPRDSPDPLPVSMPRSPLPPEGSEASGDSAQTSNVTSTAQSQTLEVPSVLPKEVEEDVAVKVAVEKEAREEHERLVGMGHQFLRALINRLMGVLLESSLYKLATLQLTLIMLKELVYCSNSPSLLTPTQTALLGEAYLHSIDVLKEHITGPMADVFLDLFEGVMELYKQPSFDTLLKEVDMLLLPVPEASSPRQQQTSGEIEKTQKAVQSFLILRELKFVLARQKDDALPLKSLPMPNLAPSQFFLVDSTTKISKFHFFVSGQKKPRVQHFTVVDGALLVLDLPEPTLSKKAPSADKPRSALITTIMPVQGIEVELMPMPANTLNVVCLIKCWKVQMQFADQRQCLDARFQLEQGRSRARQYKMKQIFGMIGFGVDDPPTPREIPMHELLSAPPEVPERDLEVPASPGEVQLDPQPLQSPPLPLRRSQELSPLMGPHLLLSDPAHPPSSPRKARFAQQQPESHPLNMSSRKCACPDCNRKPAPIVGDCRYCLSKYCADHRLPEKHACTGLDVCKREHFDRNMDKLLQEKCVSSRV